MDYIEKVSAGIFDQADEAIEEAEEEYGEVQTSVPVEKRPEREVESGDTPQDLVDIGSDEPHAEERETTTLEGPATEYTRSVAFQATQGGVEIDTPGSFKGAEATKDRLREIQAVNEELERMGHAQRYVASDSDVPGTAYAYEDAFGKYYYEKLDFDLRPSDVAEYADAEAIVALSDDEQVIETVELMAEAYANPLVDANTVEAADSWLERHMVLTDDDPGSQDTFSHEFKEAVAHVVSTVEVEETAEKSVNPSTIADFLGEMSNVDASADEIVEAVQPLFSDEEKYEGPADIDEETGLPSQAPDEGEDEEDDEKSVTPNAVAEQLVELEDVNASAEEMNEALSPLFNGAEEKQGNPEGIPDEAQGPVAPDQVPEGAQTFEGPQGGVYFVSGQESREAIDEELDDVDTRAPQEAVAEAIDEIGSLYEDMNPDILTPSGVADDIEDWVDLPEGVDSTEVAQDLIDIAQDEAGGGEGGGGEEGGGEDTRAPQEAVDEAMDELGGLYDGVNPAILTPSGVADDIDDWVDLPDDVDTLDVASDLIDELQ